MQSINKESYKRRETIPMSVSSVSSTANLYQVLYSTNSNTTGTQSRSASVTGVSGGDIVELSAEGISASASASAASGAVSGASGSGSSGGASGATICPQGNETCVGCGVCKLLTTDALTGTSSASGLSSSSSTNSVAGISDQTTNAATVNALYAYENQIKYI